MFNEKLLDDLLCVDSDLGKTPIAWLRQGPHPIQLYLYSGR
jgi:hypothetical protein